MFREHGVEHWIDVRGPSQAVYLFDTRLVGVNADNGRKLVITLLLLALLTVVGRLLRVLARGVLARTRDLLDPSGRQPAGRHFHGLRNRRHLVRRSHHVYHRPRFTLRRTSLRAAARHYGDRRVLRDSPRKDV